MKNPIAPKTIEYTIYASTGRAVAKKVLSEGYIEKVLENNSHQPEPLTSLIDDFMWSAAGDLKSRSHQFVKDTFIIDGFSYFGKETNKQRREYKFINFTPKELKILKEYALKEAKSYDDYLKKISKEKNPIADLIIPYKILGHDERVNHKNEIINVSNLPDREAAKKLLNKLIGMCDEHYFTPRRVKLKSKVFTVYRSEEKNGIDLTKAVFDLSMFNPIEIGFLKKEMLGLKYPTDQNPIAPALLTLYFRDEADDGDIYDQQVYATYDLSTGKDADWPGIEEIIEEDGSTRTLNELVNHFLDSYGTFHREDNVITSDDGDEILGMKKVYKRYYYIIINEIPLEYRRELIGLLTNSKNPIAKKDITFYLAQSWNESESFREWTQEDFIDEEEITNHTDDAVIDLINEKIKRTLRWYAGKYDHLVLERIGHGIYESNFDASKFSKTRDVFTKVKIDMSGMDPKFLKKFEAGITKSKNPTESFIPPQSVADSAALGLSLRKQFGRGMTPIGVKRSIQLSRRDPVSLKTLKRMKSFFERHAKNAWGFDGDIPKNGTIAWLGWGGDEGRDWVSSILKKQNPTPEYPFPDSLSEQIKKAYPNDLQLKELKRLTRFTKLFKEVGFGFEVRDYESWITVLIVDSDYGANTKMLAEFSITVEGSINYIIRKEYYDLKPALESQIVDGAYEALKYKLAIEKEIPRMYNLKLKKKEKGNTFYG